jgi:hypothetical protein
VRGDSELVLILIQDESKLDIPSQKFKAQKEHVRKPQVVPFLSGGAVFLEWSCVFTRALAESSAQSPAEEPDPLNRRCMAQNYTGCDPSTDLN